MELLIRNSLRLMKQAVFACSLFAAPLLQASEDFSQVMVADPYIELHTGPGRGYPVFHIVERNNPVEILKEKTGWYKVRSRKGKQGWVKREQLQQTLFAGKPLQIDAANLDSFRRYKKEIALLIGDFDGADVMTITGTWYLSQALGIEASASRVLASFSDSTHASISLVSRPLDFWRLSPFFMLGTGIIETDPKVTLVQESDAVDQTAHVGIGANLYLSRHFMFRVQYLNHVIFDSSDDNQEIDEWKAGFSLFF
ncbi:MAG: SH3 domain-containing protein [Gammaproteobacteria bacterium]